MVSKLLWGVSGKHRASRQALRRTLDAREDSPLKNRDLRDTFEHFDERLEAFFEARPDEPIVDSYVGGFAGISLRNPQSLLRGFDPNSFAATFQGKRYELRPMIAELQRLSERAWEGLPS